MATGSANRPTAIRPAATARAWHTSTAVRLARNPAMVIDGIDGRPVRARGLHAAKPVSPGYAFGHDCALMQTQEPSALAITRTSGADIHRSVSSRGGPALSRLPGMCKALSRRLPGPPLRGDDGAAEFRRAALRASLHRWGPEECRV
jgi:hypothetical protein